MLYSNVLFVLVLFNNSVYLCFAIFCDIWFSKYFFFFQEKVSFSTFNMFVQYMYIANGLHFENGYELLLLLLSKF